MGGVGRVKRTPTKGKLLIPKPERRAKKRRRASPFRKRGNLGKFRKLADDFMSLFVRCRDGWACQHCDSRDWRVMQAAHIFPKGAHPGGRFLAENVMTLCAACHKYYTHRWAEWMRWVEEKIGAIRLQRLSQLVDVRGSHDYVLQVMQWSRLLRVDGYVGNVPERYEALVKRAKRHGVDLEATVEALKGEGP